MTDIKSEDEVFELLGHSIDNENPMRKIDFTEPVSHVKNRPKECIEKVLPCLEARKDGNELNQDECNIFGITKQKVLSKYDMHNRKHEGFLGDLYDEFVDPKDPPALSKLLHTPAWGVLGFQGEDPRTDFRGGGVNSLMQILNVCRTREDLAFRMIEETKKGRFLFACNSIGVTYWLQNYFHMTEKIDPRADLNPLASRTAFKKFCALLTNDKNAFDSLHILLLEKVFNIWVSACDQNPDLTIMDYGSADKLAKTAFLAMFNERIINSVDDVQHYMSEAHILPTDVKKFSY